MNSAIGYYSLYSNTTGGDNTAMGYEALTLNTTGSDNSALGNIALLLNTTGSQNVAVGSLSLANNTDGIGNTAIGYDCLSATNAGCNYNVAVGYSALYNNYGTGNIGIGRSAILNCTGNYNIGLGSSSLLTTTGSQNIGIGYYAASSANPPIGSTGIGGADNIAIGNQPLTILGSGNYNVALGTLALGATTTGSGNIALGYYSGSNVTGDNTISIGSLGGSSNSIYVGNPATHTATYIAGISNATVTGGAAVYIDSTGKLGTGPGNAEFSFLLPAPVGPQPTQLSSTSPQLFTVILSATTNNTTRTAELTLDGNTPVTSGANLNVLIPPANSSWCYVLTTVASGNGFATTDQRRGVLKNHGGVISFAGPADVTGGGDTGDATGGSWRITQVTTSPGRFKYTVTQGTTSAFTVNWTALLEVSVAPN